MGLFITRADEDITTSLLSWDHNTLRSRRPRMFHKFALETLQQQTISIYTRTHDRLTSENHHLGRLAIRSPSTSSSRRNQKLQGCKAARQPARNQDKTSPHFTSLHIFPAALATPIGTCRNIFLQQYLLLATSISVITSIYSAIRRFRFCSDLNDGGGA